MKWFSLFWNNCKPVAWSIIGFLVLLLLTWPLSIGPEGIRAGSMVVPLQAASVADGAWRILFSGVLALSSYISILLYVREEAARSGVRRVAWFQLLFVLPFIAVALIKVGQVESMLRFVMLYSLNCIMLDGFLLLLAGLFSNCMAAGIVMVCFQLAGPIVMYLGTFHEMLPGIWGKAGFFLYLEIPFYQKIVAMWNEMDHAALWPDVSLAALVLVLGFVMQWVNRQKQEAVCGTAE